MARCALRRLRWGLLLTPALLVCACGAEWSEQLRKRTYPPDFNYIPAERLESTMWQLAAQVTRLERLLAEEPPPESTQSSVVEMLLAMERTSMQLGPGGWPSNHPRVSRNIEGFRRDLEVARREASGDPPRFLLARDIANSCTECHRGGR